MKTTRIFILCLFTTILVNAQKNAFGVKAGLADVDESVLGWNLELSYKRKLSNNLEEIDKTG